jgi:uncharacterized protein YyaL (SSP411 family)
MKNKKIPEISSPAKQSKRWLAIALLGLVAIVCAFGIRRWKVWSSTNSYQFSKVDSNGKTYTNCLIHSHDPYLLMHAHNPVDWYPWGAEAVQKAKRENKPIFLSVGYSTCYWCHVAEKEIYSDPKIAKLMNQWFVNIKVDREQRPDVDRVYLLATQILTGGGGWPNNIFLTPDLKPFFAGSYFPPTDQGGQHSFPSILQSLHQAWTTNPSKVKEEAERVYQSLQQVQRNSSVNTKKTIQPKQWLDQAAAESASSFDKVDGGFSGDGRTMFPQEPMLAMLLTDYKRDNDAKSLSMVTATLLSMAEGGVMDQVAGGFHRYSTEPTWSIPHFEKMLTDNAQLLDLYSQAYEATHKPLFKQVALRTAHYLTDEMRSPKGGFYSAQDSQVNNVEGVSYVWTRQEIQSVLGDADANRILALYALTPMPQSFGGQQQSPGAVLRLDRAKAQSLAAKNQLAAAVDALTPLLDTLLTARNKRPQPAHDEKIVTSSNALAIMGFLQAGRVLKNQRMTQTAIDTANWEWSHAFDAKSGLLQHHFFHGYAGEAGFLNDYALLGQAFMALNKITESGVWRDRARQIADAMLSRFARPDGRLATTTDSINLLIAPPVEGDSVEPSGQSAAISLLLRLTADGGSIHYANAARRAFDFIDAQVAANPSNWGALLATFNQPKLLIALLQTQQPQKTNRLPNSANHVQATSALTPTKDGAMLKVTIEIDKGYHLNANPASSPNLVPTQLSVYGYPDLKVQYPTSHLFKAPFAVQGIGVYTGQVQLQTRLNHLPKKPIKVSLQVQACNDKYCLMPATIILNAR